MSVSTTVTIVMAIMAMAIMGAIYIGLHFSKKSAEKFRKQRENETEK